jgi:hypothetical protein
MMRAACNSTNANGKQRAEFTVLTNESVPDFLEAGRPDFAKVCPPRSAAVLVADLSPLLLGPMDAR